MPNFIHYETVRVTQLTAPAASYDGWKVNLRPPNVGDVGVVVEVLQAAGAPERFVVECMDEQSGETLWLSELDATELASVPSVRKASAGADEKSKLEDLGPQYGSVIEPGDVVSARIELIRGALTVPNGRHGVVVEGNESVVLVRFPLVVGREKKLKKVWVPRRAVWVEVKSADVLRDPAHPRGPKADGEWAALEKDELVSLGARLKRAIKVPPPHAFTGKTVSANRVGTIVQCVESASDGVIYVINVTLPDPASYQGYRFTNLEARRDEFVLEDPKKAKGIQLF
ncbi:MAG: hypothetical protein JWM74_154 [Myxococcaceae bacterium]|nr:hypothetical protein [Myxococcaceae bacterium]